MSIVNSFPGYELVYDPTKKDEDSRWRNMYRGIDLGHGGYVYSEPGIYHNVALLDVGGLHPASILELNKFGEYTERYRAIRDARIAIKHYDYDSVRGMLNGVFDPFLTDDDSAEKLALALKLFLNSCYGYCSAKFENPFRDSRDHGNIVALRGALFIKTLQDEVVKRGFKVVHCKTDSIKVPGATDEIIAFIQDFATKYGYEMEHEATYDRMCLVDNAQYIAKYDAYGARNKRGKHANEWTATGAKFQHPVIFKSLFSREPIEFEDMREVKEVKAPAAIYLDMNEGLPDVTVEEKLLEKALKNSNSDQAYIEDLRERIAKGHNYIFVGRVGSFMPMREGAGGGVLVAKRGDKYSAVAGTKGYRWLEDEVVQTVGKENELDNEYYRQLVDEAVAEISKYGDFEAFVG